MAYEIKSQGLVIAFFGFACLAATASAEIPATLPSIDVFGGLPSLEDLVISPNGKRIAFVKTSGEARFVYAYDLGTSAPLAGVKVGDTKLRSVQWGGRQQSARDRLANQPAADRL